jgi:hypothetical protein
MNQKPSFGWQDHYWIYRSILQGFRVFEIAAAIPCRGASITGVRIRLGFPYHYEKGPAYGISEIARELGVSRQCIHEKVKKCRNPYMKLRPGRKAKARPAELPA